MPEPAWLSRILLDYMHVELIRNYGGSPGIRDANLIESALARPRNKWSYGEKDVAEFAAAYGYGLARNHGYVDGNKRIVVCVGLVQMIMRLKSVYLSTRQTTSRSWQCLYSCTKTVFS